VVTTAFCLYIFAQTGVSFISKRLNEMMNHSLYICNLILGYILKWNSKANNCNKLTAAYMRSPNQYGVILL